MKFPERKQDLLLVFTTLGCLVLGYFSYQQNVVIDVLNQEIIRQAAKQHRTRLDKYALEKELQRLKVKHNQQPDSTSVKN